MERSLRSSRRVAAEPPEGKDAPCGLRGFGDQRGAAKHWLLLFLVVGVWCLQKPAGVYYMKYRLKVKAADAIRDAKRADPVEIKRVMMDSIKEIGAKVAPSQVQVSALGESGPFEVTIVYTDTLDFKFTRKPVKFTIREKKNMLVRGD